MSVGGDVGVVGVVGVAVSVGGGVGVLSTWNFEELNFLAAHIEIVSFGY